MYKILMSLLFLLLMSGCVYSPLLSQLVNVDPNVCPMPMPACKAVFGWDDDFGYRPKKTRDNVPVVGYETTAEYVVLAVYSVPLYVCFVISCIASDALFSPYNVPAYLYYKDQKGRFELAEGDREYVLSWRGLHANCVVSKVIFRVERGYVDFSGKTNSGELFEKRLSSSCDLKAISHRVGCGPCAGVPRSYEISCPNDQENGKWWADFSYDERIRFKFSDDFQGSISLEDEL